MLIQTETLFIKIIVCCIQLNTCREDYFLKDNDERSAMGAKARALRKLCLLYLCPKN